MARPMANPSKAKGTAAETRVVKYLKSFGIKAERKALSGSNDKGDIQVDVGWSVGLIMEVKSGKQTTNPTRKQLDEWMNQTMTEGKNSHCLSLLVVARFGKNPSDYDVWQQVSEDDPLRRHWYLDDWCKHYGK